MALIDSPLSSCTAPWPNRRRSDRCNILDLRIHFLTPGITRVPGVEIASGYVIHRLCMDEERSSIGDQNNLRLIGQTGPSKVFTEWSRKWITAGRSPK